MRENVGSTSGPECGMGAPMTTMRILLVVC